jgi:hypothetical protein
MGAITTRLRSSIHPIFPSENNVGQGIASIKDFSLSTQSRLALRMSATVARVKY